MSARRLGAWKTPKPAPHAAIRHPPRDVAEARIRREGGEQTQAKAEAHEPDPAEQARGIAVREAPGQGSHEGDRDGPWHHQEAGLELGTPERLLKQERQGHEGEALRHEGTRGGGRREGEERARQQVDGQHRSRMAGLPPKEQEAEDHRAAEFGTVAPARPLVGDLAEPQHEKGDGDDGEDRSGREAASPSSPPA